MTRLSKPGLVLIALAALLRNAPSPAQALEERYGPRLAAFDALAPKEMAADHTTGFAIALMIGDATWARAYGFADVEDGSPMKPESSFRLASITKPMTAVAIVQLADAGKLDLDAEIQTYVPYFPRKSHPITVRQLLGHLGGISHYKNPAAELHIKEHRDTRQAIEIFKDFDLVAEPGTKYSYTTYGFNLLGAAIEGASGQSYGDYMRDHVWAPLEMKDTRMDDPRAIIPNRVRGYEWADGKLRNSEFVDISSRFAGGGTRTTVLDLLKFARGFMDGKVVSRARVDEMTRPMTLRDGHDTDYGMGWGLDPQNGRFIVSHSGGQNETRTLLFLLPGRNAAIAAATNFESGDLFWFVQALAAQVFDERWDRSGGSAAYVPGKVERGEFAAARDAFQFGLSSYEKRGGPLTEDPKRLSEAFAFFNQCVDPKALKASLDATRKKCRDGLHPVTDEPLPVVGSFMATTLSARGGVQGLERYHVQGPAAFFADYIQAYRGNPAIPRAYRFDPGFERQVALWNRDWPRTFNEYARTTAVTVFEPLDARRLRQTFAGASIYPDLSSEIGDVARLDCREGKREPALEAARLNVALYPSSAAPVAYLAGTQLCFGDSGQARALLQKARALDEGETYAGAGFLNGMAYDFAEMGKLDAATEVLRVAIDLNPKAANLYDSLGELEAKAGRRDQAIAAYKKAVELDPKLESSIRALKELEKPAP
ncbi:MAG: serine hydrolase [Thermoanaerobaculia bacterium]